MSLIETFTTKDAYCLVSYQNLLIPQEKERLWNPRNKEAPDEIRMKFGGKGMRLYHPPDIRALDYVPKVGSRIFLDLFNDGNKILTEAVADSIMAYVDEGWNGWGMCTEYASKREAEQALISTLAATHEPVIATVTPTLHKYYKGLLVQEWKKKKEALKSEGEFSNNPFANLKDILKK